MVLTITPDQLGDYAVICNEYCGIGHHTMLGKIRVMEN
jgi:cytochrome c oxidase subunit 2